MVSKLDQSVGRIFKELELKDMLKNAIVVFASDNGAPCNGIFNNWGSNYPFRGQKNTLWEGGVRVPAVVWSPLITQSSRVSNDLMHISDWLPTLLAAAGYDTNKLKVDGVNQWHSISKGRVSPRDSLLIDILPNSPRSSAIIVGPFKYIKGATSSPQVSTDINGYLNLDSIFSKNTPAYKLEDLLTSETWIALNKYDNKKLSLEQVELMRIESLVTCGDIHHNKTSTMDCDGGHCLFDIFTDPCEQKNLAGRFPLLTKHFDSILQSYRLEYHPERLLDQHSDPDLFNGTWNIWDS